MIINNWVAGLMLVSLPILSYLWYKDGYRIGYIKGYHSGRKAVRDMLDPIILRQNEKIEYLSQFIEKGENDE